MRSGLLMAIAFAAASCMGASATSDPTAIATPATPTQTPIPPPTPAPTLAPTVTPYVSPSPTPIPRGLTVDLTFLGSYVDLHLKGFYAERQGTYCYWYSTGGPSFLHSIRINPQELGVNGLEFSFYDEDGPEGRPGTIILTFYEGSVKHMSAFKPDSGLAEWSKGSVTVASDQSGISIDVQAYEGYVKYPWTSLKGTITCHK